MGISFSPLLRGTTSKYSCSLYMSETISTMHHDKAQRGTTVMNLCNINVVKTGISSNATFPLCVASMSHSPPLLRHDLHAFALSLRSPYASHSHHVSQAPSASLQDILSYLCKRSLVLLVRFNVVCESMSNSLNYALSSDTWPVVFFSTEESGVRPRWDTIEDFTSRGKHFLQRNLWRPLLPHVIYVQYMSKYVTPAVLLIGTTCKILCSLLSSRQRGQAHHPVMLAI